MQLVHSQLTIPEKAKRPTKSQLVHAQQQLGLRRKEFADFESALRDPEIVALIEEVRKVSPGWMPKFNK